MPSNVCLLDHAQPQTVCLSSCDVAIHGQSFAHGAVTENLAAGYPATRPGMFNIGLLHTSATGREGHENYAPCTLEDLQSKQYDYWALGHVHKREVLCREPPIVFPGNIQGRHIRETGSKGCTLVSVDEQHRVRLEPQSLDVFRWELCRVDATDAASPGDLLDRVRGRLAEMVKQAEGRSLAVRVEIAGACPAHQSLASAPVGWTNEIRAAAQDVGCGGLWVEKVLVDTSPPARLDPAALLDGPLGELVEYVRELRAAPESLLALDPALLDFQEKLPPELREGPDALGLDRPPTLRQLLDQVEQMLIQQLTSAEAGA
jgi:hypothetical protein